MAGILVTPASALGSMVSLQAAKAVAAAPTVKSVSPRSGFIAGGTRVTVVGAHFSRVKAVKFGTVLGKSLKVVSTTKLQVTAPSHLAGRVDILVKTAYGTSRVVAADRYSYQPPAPGSYGGGFVTFYVSPNSAKVQDVSITPGAVNLSCTPGGSYQDGSFNIPEMTIAPNGSFTGVTKESGVVGTAPAQFTYTFKGQFNSTTTAAGTWRDDVTYNDGQETSCTTNTQPWQMTRSSQGAQTSSPPPAGSYAGGFVTFYVSPSGTQVQDVSITPGAVNLRCTPGGTYQDGSFNVADVAIAADGSFVGTATESGIVGNVPAQFTYTFRGHFHGTDSSGQERAAGTWRDDITYNNGAQTSCTTNAQPWQMTRTSQGTQTASPPPSGGYSGNFVTFTVSADSTQVQNVSITPGAVNLRCTPGGTYQDSHFNIAQVTIASDGSFTGTAMQSGVVGNTPAQFTYTFSGHFHGTNSNGQERAAGTWRDDITYNNGTQTTCTTNTEPWAAARS